jgi:hypothetical protein
MFSSFITGFKEGFGNLKHANRIEFIPMPYTPENSTNNVVSPPKYVPPEDFKVKEYTGNKHTDQSVSRKRTNTKETKSDDLPPGVKAFNLPDGSVVYINTNEVNYSEASVIDSIMGNK